jgi:diphosphoinositol-polyphosphate diphosphatase
VRALIVQPRAVAVAIPFSISANGSKMICLVTSRKHDSYYVLPKGGVEEGESGREAAIRELWEEAGLRPISSTLADDSLNVGSKVTIVLDHKPHKKSPSEDPLQKGFVARAKYEAHEIRVAQGEPTSELVDWPEKNERERKWVSFQEAVELIAWRKDIHQLLLQSSLAG